MAAKTTKRSYNSSRRVLQAAQTRDEVLRAATELFRETGWTSTTLAAIAERAGVSVETVYKGFGSKKGLLRAAFDVAVVGDSEPIPFVERPEFRAFGEGSLEQRIATTATVTASIHERGAALWLALVEASRSDDEVDGWRLEMEQRRHLEVGRSTAAVLDEQPDDQLVTMLWILYGAETYLKLTGDRGFDRAQYEAFLIEASTRLVGQR